MIGRPDRLQRIIQHHDASLMTTPPSRAATVMTRMQNRMRASSRIVLLTAIGAAACSGDSSPKEAASDVAAAGAPSGAASASTSSPPAIASGRYIGIRHDPLPAGVVSEGGAVVRIDGADYAFTRVKTPHGGMVWLDSIAGEKGQTPIKIVRAEVRVPALARDERLLMASCDVGGKLDGRVVAIVVNESRTSNETKFGAVRQAWRADARRGRFDVIPVAGITCEDPGTS